MDLKNNICVHDRFGGKVYLYTHKKGLELFPILQAALIRGKDKLQDEQYLTRIVFSEMIKETDLNDVDNFGISAFLGDNELPIFVVDGYNGRVLLEDGQCLTTCPYPGVAWTFNEFVKLKEDPRIAILQAEYEASKK